MQSQITKISDALAAVVKIVGEMRQENGKHGQLVQLVKKLDEEVGEIGAHIRDTPSPSEFRNFANMLNSIAAGVEGAGIEIPEFQVESDGERPKYQADSRERKMGLQTREQRPLFSAKSQGRSEQTRPSSIGRNEQQRNGRGVWFSEDGRVSPTPEDDDDDISSAIELVRNSRNTVASRERNR